MQEQGKESSTDNQNKKKENNLKEKKDLICCHDAGLGYEYATDTGTASIKASALGNEVVNAQKDFNPVTTLKTLLSKLMKK